MGRQVVNAAPGSWVSCSLVEPGLDRGLVIGKYGKGTYIYTGYSFFRELPAGVKGAYRLFANLV